MFKFLPRFMLVVVILAAIMSVVAYGQLQRFMDAPLSLPEQGFEYTVARGSSLNKVIQQLSAQQVLASPYYLKIYSRLSGSGEKISAGDYIFPFGLTPRQLLTKLERGDVRLFQITLVEGWNLRQVLALLRTEPLLKQTIAANAATILPQHLLLASDMGSLEGLLFPDTYRFHSGSSDVEVLQQAYRRMQRVLAEEWSQRAMKLPYSDPYQALIMASIVEKETGQANEREQIAGVFVRRLQQGMRLQTDPTIIYGLGESFDGNLRTRHLKDSNNLYNTYRHNGLTPTPIALAGREAIRAALHPAKGETLYFVAKGDGTHHFSKTLEEHQKAVRQYQIYQRKKNYSSAPRVKAAG